jgi:hypothetical protein
MAIPAASTKKVVKNTFIFLTVTVLTTFVVAAVILEGRRVKRENKLLEYEVW